ncbi:uncharacterized protein PFL1_00588 [Pseudozyma flocculosa PF-1]|uniref:uncharacterized protein n=1 Tax=Pseudozyma flocculosa PF-1 TaxID=1277687 RepID=UPI00045613A4|nr:uncharacterized protein PFL1_00588 [Pseudozyma flocculosa PF-1]EPQ32392.1 hypothetical protein PFL1_00588 [Pseudozyma flocculosa PF-1]
MPDPSLPYQYFMMGEMSATAPFRHNSAQYPNLDCKISSAISQLPDRQTWQCTGDRDAFCKECFRVRDEMDAVHRGKYRQQGCD